MSHPPASPYEALVGKRWARYRPRFERFARGGWLSWNWAAFFATLAWLRYRRLHAWSLAYFLVSAPVLLVLLMVSANGDSCERALDPGATNTLQVVALGLLVLVCLVPPLVADRLYYNHLRNRTALPAGAAGTGGVAGALLLQAFLLVGAAVTIPSYANYTYRARIAEGATLAGSAKLPLAEYFADHNRLPARIEELKIPGAGRYVERLVLDPDGTVRAIFGPGGGKLAGRSVGHTPVIKDGRIVEWTCRSGDLPELCLATSCRRR